MVKESQLLAEQSPIDGVFALDFGQQALQLGAASPGGMRRLRIHHRLQQGQGHLPGEDPEADSGALEQPAAVPFEQLAVLNLDLEAPRMLNHLLDVTPPDGPAPLENN